MIDFRELAIPIADLAWLVCIVLPFLWLLVRLPRLIRWWRYYDNGCSVRLAWYLSGGLR